MSKNEAVYVLYENDKPIDMGTIKYLANKYKVQKETMYFLTTPSCYKRRKNGKKLIKADEEDIMKTEFDGKLIDIFELNNMTELELKTERFRRDKNMAELLVKNYDKKNKILLEENAKLKNKEKILATIELQLEERINNAVEKKLKTITLEYAQQMLSYIKKAYEYIEKEEGKEGNEEFN